MVTAEQAMSRMKWPPDNSEGLKVALASVAFLMVWEFLLDNILGCLHHPLLVCQARCSAVQCNSTKQVRVLSVVLVVHLHGQQ